MTGTEFAVALVAGCFALYSLLITIGCFYDRRKWEKTLKAAEVETASEKLWAGRWRDEAVKQDKRRHELDQGVGRAICRIISEHTDERVDRYKYKAEPSHYYGQRHNHIATGLLRALNILEVETGKYKEEEEEPSPAYLNALACHTHKAASTVKEYPPADKCVVCGRPSATHRWGQLNVELVDAPYTAKVTVSIGEYDYWKTRKPLDLCQTDADLLDKSGGMVVFYLGKHPCTREQQIAVRQSQAADRQRRKDMARLRWEKDKARLQPTAPYPTLPPFDGCKVCGAGAYTYRWGQVTSTLSSANYEEVTRATVEWQKYDTNYSVGWFPVCAHHAAVLDKHGTVTRTTHGRTHRPRGYSCG